ncbi:MAG TPA: hypothetical protein VGR78_12650 [Verrucomicrobiae bacterium]|nr:hypothetical protein [Verrucomicrobiae bacterium]
MRKDRDGVRRGLFRVDPGKQSARARVLQAKDPATIKPLPALMGRVKNLKMRLLITALPPVQELAFNPLLFFNALGARRTAHPNRLNKINIRLPFVVTERLPQLGVA